MVTKATNFLRLAASVIMVIVVIMVVSGCAGYRFGDVSRVYCGATTEEIRADAKAVLSDKGIKITVDYCSSFGLVDSIADSVKGSK
jgi:hypothetical protein